MKNKIEILAQKINAISYGDLNDATEQEISSQMSQTVGTILFSGAISEMTLSADARRNVYVVVRDEIDNTSHYRSDEQIDNLKLLLSLMNTKQ